jgi:neutral ceramidase
MKRNNRAFTSAASDLGAAAVALLLALNAAAGEVRVGLAKTDITPPLGMPMAGYYHERGADGVLDPLYSKAMVIEEDGERAALVVLDIIGVTRSVTDQARTLVEQNTGIKGGHVMISATHAHTGPELANRGRRGPEIGSDKEIAVKYTEGLPKLIAESVRLANERLQPVRLSVAKGHCDGVAFNRRYFMRDGTTAWNPGRLNPNIVMPAGPTDPEVRILYLERADATDPMRGIATYVNFAMHPDTTGGSKFSADWPGALGRVLGTYHGPDHLTIVANGTCGNLNHFDVSWKWPSGGPGEQNRIATILGAAVFQAYKDLKPVLPGPLQVRSEIVSIDLPTITPDQVEEAKVTLQNTKDDTGSNFMKLVRAHRVLDVASRQGKQPQVEVQVVTLGKEVAWVALPGEIFVELGLALKKRSPFPQTFIAELANENLGYVPDRRSFAEGAYEPESARCAPGSGEKLVDTAARLLAAAYDGAK